MLNLFQHPCAVLDVTADVGGRAWTLKRACPEQGRRVQGDKEELLP